MSNLLDDTHNIPKVHKPICEYKPQTKCLLWHVHAHGVQGKGKDTKKHRQSQMEVFEHRIAFFGDGRDYYSRAVQGEEEAHTTENVDGLLPGDDTEGVRRNDEQDA